MDLSKLTPAEAIFDLNPVSEDQIPAWMTPADAEFWRLARSSFDVMLRRGWSAKLSTGGMWYVWGWNLPACVIEDTDPFTCLVEADRWYAEHIEKKEKP